VIRLPQVHNTVKQGLITRLIEVARSKGVSAYVNEWLNRWPAAHLSDVARLFRPCWNPVKLGQSTMLSPKKASRCAQLRM
jgi:hypothetical protein